MDNSAAGSDAEEQRRTQGDHSDEHGRAPGTGPAGGAGPAARERGRYRGEQTRYFRDVWLPRLRAGGVNVQVLPVFIEPATP